MLKVSAFEKKSRIRCSQDEGLEIFRFWAKLFVCPTGSRHLGRKKLVPMMKTSVAIKANSNISEMVNGHLFQSPQTTAWIKEHFHKLIPKLSMWEGYQCIEEK